MSVNVGQPREVGWKGETVTTGIFKEPVEGRVMLRTLNLEGDRQADLTVHGGPEKAVYVYPSEHYEYWRKELPGVPLPWGAFGENLTATGLLDSGPDRRPASNREERVCGDPTPDAVLQAQCALPAARHGQALPSE